MIDALKLSHGRQKRAANAKVARILSHMPANEEQVIRDHIRSIEAAKSKADAKLRAQREVMIIARVHGAHR